MSRRGWAMALVLALVVLYSPALTVPEANAWHRFHFYYYFPYYYYYYDYGYYYSYYTMTVNTNPPGLSSAAAGSGSYRYGSIAAFTANEIVQGDPGVRYVFTGWSGDSSGTSTTGSAMMDGSKTVTANYKTQYFLKVVVNPSGLVTVSGEGWYDAGTKVDMGGAPSPIGDSGKRQVFVGWMVDGSAAQGNPISVVVDRPHVATAAYKTQYYLRINSPLGGIQGEGWYDAGSSATLSAPGPVPAGGVMGALGGKFVFDNWGGDMSGSSQALTVAMDSPHVIVANWATDYTMVYVSVILLSALTFLAGIVVSRRVPALRIPRMPLARMMKRQTHQAYGRTRRGTPAHEPAHQPHTSHQS